MKPQKMQPRNPFLVYGYANPRYFCDREAETQQMLSALENERNLTLIAPRRMGKTGLIKNVFYTLQEEKPEVVSFYMDIFATRDLASFVRLLAKTVLGQLDTLSESALHKLTSFFRSCRPVISADELTGVPTVTLDFVVDKSEQTLKEIFEPVYLTTLRDIYSENLTDIVTDDPEIFQQITSYPEEGTEALLRSYIQFIPNVRFIFAGSSQHLMQEMFVSAKRPFYQSTQLMVLREIDEESYYRFARNFFELRGQELDKSVFHWIYTRFEGHTWYMQAMLNRLYERNEPVVDITQAEQVLMGLLEENTPVYQNLIIMLTDNQLALMKAIAHEGKVTAPNSGEFILGHGLKTPSSVNAALKSLVEKELVYKSTGGYMVYDRFMGIWLLRN